MSAEDRLKRMRRAILREWRGGDEPDHPDSRVHKPKEFLSAILKQANAAEGIEEEKVRELWKEIAGEFVAMHAAPNSLKRGCLSLQVLQPAMRFQLEQMKPQLQQKLNKALGEGVVKSIRFSLG